MPTNLRMELINLKKKYKNRRRTVHAVDGISLRLPEKGLVFFLGESGSGKTTLLNLISLQEKPSSGKILLGGKDICRCREKDKDQLKNHYFAILTQDLNLLSDFSVFDNLKLAREIQGEKLSREEAREVISRFGLGEEILDESPDRLSGGQRQRVALSRALIKDFKVLIADEPTGSLDKANATAVIEAMKEISKDRLVLVSTHDDDLANQYGDRTLHMERGKIIEDSGSDPLQKEESPIDFKAKMKAPLKAIGRLSLHGVFHSAPRFIFSLLSTVLTLSVFMTTLSFCTYNETAVAYESFKADGVTYAQINRYKKMKYGYDASTDINLSEEKAMQELFGDTLVYQSYLNEVATAIYDGATCASSYACSISGPNVSTFGFQIIGRLPEPNGQLEVALTKWNCIEVGWLDESNQNDPAALQRIIETKTLSMNFDAYSGDNTRKQVKIVGILDTNFHPNPSPNENVYLEQQKEVERKKYEISGGVFLEPGLFRQMVQKEKDGSIRLYAPISSKPIEAAKRYGEQNHKSPDGKPETLFVETRMKSILEQTKSFQEAYSIIIIALTVVLTIVTIFSLISMTSSSVRSLSSSVQILRSMGISRSGGNAIYLLETTLITLGCGILSILPYFLMNWGVGEFTKSQLAMTISPFAFRAWIILVSILVMLVFNLLVTLLTMLGCGSSKTVRYIK